MLRSSISRKDGCAEQPGSTITVSFDLCYESTDRFEEMVREALSCKPPEIRVDLGSVKAMDSSGLRSLIAARRLCNDQGADLELSQASECAAKVIRMSGLGHVFRIPEPAVCPTTEPEHDNTTPVYTNWRIYEHVADSDPSLIAVMRDKVARIAADAGVEGDALCDVRIAVGEALSNAYKHGSVNKGVDKITLRCMTCPEALVIEVQDQGKPFDANATGEPDPNELKDHGMGIYLMRQAMDVVEFRSQGGGNSVRMIKWLSSGRANSG